MRNRILTVLLALMMVLSMFASVVPAVAETGSTVRVTASSKTSKKKKTVAPKKITIEGPKSVAVKKQIKLKATVSPAEAKQNVVWSTSDPAIATVTSKGVVKGVSPGKVTIIATSKANDKVLKKYKITVKKNAVKELSVTGAPETLDLAGTKTAQLSVSVAPKDASKDATWISSDPSVATVTAKGLVTAVKKGTVTITATATDGSKKKASVNIQVVDSSKITGDIQSFLGKTIDEVNALLEEPLKKSDNKSYYYTNQYLEVFAPEVEGRTKITDITIQKGTLFSLYGVKIGMSKSEAVSKLESLGWKKGGEDPSQVWFYIEDAITLLLEGDKVVSIFTTTVWGNG